MTRPEKISGRYFPPGSSASIDAILSGTPDDLQIACSDGSGTRQVTVVEMTDRLASVARKLTFDDGSVFETADNDAVDRFFDKHLS